MLIDLLTIRRIMMERMTIFNVKKNLSKGVITIGILVGIFGLILLSRALYTGFDTHVIDGDWNTVVIIGQGIFFILLGFQQLKYRDFFIEWDENKISYLLNGDKQIKYIDISNIKAIEINSNKIIILVTEIQNKIETNKEIELNFKQVDSDIMKRIRDKFKELKSNISLG